jgi:CheY-like chemotaxis protein
VLPRTDVEAVTAPAAAATRVAGPRRSVLLVDDNRDAADTLASVLRLLGHEVAVATGGHEALALFERTTDWDTFILDVGMPDMTGHELARRLRDRMGPRPAHFIALTGYGQEHDEAASRAAGFDHHLVKPVDIDRIVALLAE